MVKEFKLNAQLGVIKQTKKERMFNVGNKNIYGSADARDKSISNV